MKKAAIIFAILLLVAVGLWAVINTTAKVSRIEVKGIEGTIVDEKGQPLGGCFIIYDYTVRGDGWVATKPPTAGSIIETDANGHFQIPGKTISINPVLHEEARLQVWRVFSPKTHTATIVEPDWSYPGDIEGEIVGRSQEKKLVFYDLSNYPAAWFRHVKMMQDTMSDLDVTGQINKHSSDQLSKRSPYLENCDEEMSKLSTAVSNDLVRFKALYYDALYEQTKALKIPNDPQMGKTYGRLLDHGIF